MACRRHGMLRLRAFPAMLWAMSSPHRSPAAVLAVLLVLSLGSCTGEPEPQRTGSPTPTPTTTATGAAPSLRERAAPYDVAYRRVAGRLPDGRRARSLRAITRPVRAWVDDAFVTGPWPRRRFNAAVVPFNRDTTRMARRDARLLTLQALGGSLVEVVPERRRIRVSATAVRGRVVGATVHVDLQVLGVDRQRRRHRVHVRGDLYLTHSKAQGWKIFGYDLDRWADKGAATVEGGRG